MLNAHGVRKEEPILRTLGQDDGVDISNFLDVEIMERPPFPKDVTLVESPMQAPDHRIIIRKYAQNANLVD